MTPPVVNTEAATRARLRPRVLVVDDEPVTVELVHDVIGRAGEYRVLSARDLAEARQILATEKVDLLLADVHLPDGNGMELLPQLRQRNPAAAAVVITGQPSISGAIHALRAGVVDFLPKPFTAEHLLERVKLAMKQQASVARREIRLARLKQAVRKLNTTRHTISRKVDLLCNDLVSAYGELSRLVDTVRNQEAFRKLVEQANDLEQMLCHAMDWILRQVGYCNVAIWLASEEHVFELGAYMKYTIAGEPELTEAMRSGLLPLITREGSVHLFGPEARQQLTDAEYELLGGQEIVGCNCTYLGESLAVIVLFRDEKSPFTDEDVAMLRAISPIFAVALANIVRRSQDDQDSSEEDDGGTLLDESGGPGDGDGFKPPRPGKSDADWWKRGDPPPF
ncbi:response regulator [Fontivita pretiosa]|uniref:response regulator n=1 Tax=Fontivita pretiosa TaxID=2989684 RepID=UPI003D16F1E6